MLLDNDGNAIFIYTPPSLHSAGDVFAKLKKIGLEAVPVGEPGEPVEAIPEEQVEFLAEIEHGRWNAERLLGL